MNNITLTETIPALKHYDVVVVGGGVAGCAAAVAARRSGVGRVLLLEKSNLLGGLATIGLINLFVPLCNGRGKQIIFGMAEEFLHLAIRYGYDTVPPDWRNGPPAEPTTQRYVTRYSPQIFAVALTGLLHDEGVEVAYDAVGVSPLMDGKRCRGIIMESKSGREFVAADIVIDATGDGDILFRAGVPTIQGGNYFTYAGHGISLDSCAKAVAEGDIGKAVGFYHGSARATLYGKGQPEGMKLFTGTSVEDVSDYIRLSQLDMLEALKKDDRRSRDIVTLPTMPQFRTTRRLAGDYELNPDDAYRHFDDSIGAICDFDRRDYLFEVPYRTLCRRGYDNLLTAGRSASAAGYAWDVLRVIPPAIVTGQAAGTAAALALRTQCAVADIDIQALQRQLTEGNLMIHFDDTLIPKVDVEGTGEVVSSDHF